MHFYKFNPTFQQIFLTSLIGSYSRLSDPKLRGAKLQHFCWKLPITLNDLPEKLNKIMKINSEKPTFIAKSNYFNIAYQT